MVDVDLEVSEELNESAIKEREAMVRKKQYEFEKMQTKENKEKLEVAQKKGTKKYIPWIIVVLVLVVLGVLVFAFDLV